MQQASYKEGITWLKSDGQRRRAVVRGTVSDIVYRREQDDWSVLTVTFAGPQGTRWVRVVGHTAAQPGHEVAAEGWYSRREVPRQSGVQAIDEIRAERIVASKPSTGAGVAGFLQANVKGIGEALARRMVQAFGNELGEIVDKDPERLLQVQGIKPRHVQAIRSVWREAAAQAEIMAFLHEQGLSAAVCRRIHRRYGDAAREVLTRNPYRLAQDIRGIGFLKADEIAARLGVPKSSPYRLRAGLLHVLQQATAAGHCGVRSEDLLRQAAQALGVQQGLQQALQELLSPEEGKPPVVQDRGVVWLRYLYEQEREVARQLAAMARQKAPWRVKPDELQQHIEQAQRKAGIVLGDAQLQAVNMALTSMVSIITGGPGCGKTTTLNVVLDVMRRLGVCYELAAPTGKAAQRAAQATGAPAATLHRLLKIGQDGPQVTLSCDVLVVDECSMVDVELMHHILQGISANTALILVGDVDQLPSVGPGAVLADLLASKRLASVKLSVVHRQAAGSLIIEAAHRVNRGAVPSVQRSDGDFFFLSEKNARELQAALQSEEPAQVSMAAQGLVLDLVKRRLPARYGLDPFDDIMVLAPMNKGHCGVHALNALLQRELNAANLPHAWKSGAASFAPGDKVIQTRNNYELGVFNGDMGRIVEIDRKGEHLVIQYDERLVQHPFDDADELKLAYAITVHKSQGSQAKCVVVPVLTEHFAMLQRNLLYTAITRAQKLCVLVGTTKAVAIAVKKVDANKRLTMLKHFLEEM